VIQEKISWSMIADKSRQMINFRFAFHQLRKRRNREISQPVKYKLQRLVKNTKKI